MVIFVMNTFRIHEKIDMMCLEHNISNNELRTKYANSTIESWNVTEMENISIHLESSPQVLLTRLKF